MPTASFKMRYTVASRLLPKPSRRRPGQPIEPEVKFVVAHDTGNPGSTAAGNVAYYQASSNAESASAHLFVDDREIVECVPALTGAPERAWHVLYRVSADDRLYGHDANDAAIGVEYCFGGHIDADEAYRRYVWTLALLCHRFELDPARSVVGHFFLDPTRRTDPASGLAHSRRSYEGLLRDVVAEHAECTGRSPAQTPGRFFPSPGRATTTVRLNVRRGLPSLRSAVARVVPTGTVLAYEGYVEDGEPVNGSARWLRDADGNWFWSGGVT